MEDPKDYKLDVKVRNNKLLYFMRAKGIDTAAQLSNATGISQSGIGKILNLKKPLYDLNGNVHLHYRQLADFFNVLPDMLVPKSHRYTGLTNNKVSMDVSFENIQTLLTDTRQSKRIVDTLIQLETHNILDTLSDRERMVIVHRWGLEGHILTYDKIGSLLGVSKDRVRQIEYKTRYKIAKKILYGKNRKLLDLLNDKGL